MQGSKSEDLFEHGDLEGPPPSRETRRSYEGPKQTSVTRSTTQAGLILVTVDVSETWGTYEGPKPKIVTRITKSGCLQHRNQRMQPRNTNAANIILAFLYVCVRAGILLHAILGSISPELSAYAYIYAWRRVILQESTAPTTSLSAPLP